jgi:hypothetical protein
MDIKNDILSSHTATVAFTGQFIGSNRPVERRFIPHLFQLSRINAGVGNILPKGTGLVVRMRLFNTSYYGNFT